MTVHFLHTSDWHLGQFFYGHSRQYEHEQFLAWLLEQIAQQQPHALLIAGDLFDVINPASSAQKQLYQFLADAHQRAPHMQTLMIAGNHDSGYRIEQVEPLLEKYNAKTVGIVHWNADRTLDFDRLIIPIHDAQGQIVAWCVALPFLRPAEITGYNEATADTSRAIEYIHQRVIAEAKARKSPEQALILMTHAHLQGAETSDSERQIVIGNQEALSTQLFGDEVDYVALGHLHKPQKVQHEHIRYSGAPIPLSFSEIHYPHQVLNIHIQPQQQQKLAIEKLPIPRTVPLYRLAGELDEVLQQLRDLPNGAAQAIDQRAFVDIEYFSLKPPPPDLRLQIEKLLPEQQYRLVRISRKLVNTDPTANTTSKIDLAPPTPESLFHDLWEKMGYEQDPEVMQDFLTLLDEANDALHPTEP